MVSFSPITNQEESKMKFYFTGKLSVTSPVLEAAVESGELMSGVNPVAVSHS